MNKELLQPLSGFRDYRGDSKYRLIEKLQAIFDAYGYEGLETPNIERKEILLSSYGEDAQKQLYQFEDNGKREVGLRYDLTLSLARFVALNKNTLVFPYKRYEIGNAWRAERAQKGRLRQFTQADIDIVGSSSLEAEKELLLILARFVRDSSIPLTCQFNDRRIVSNIFEVIGITEAESRRLLRLLDKKDKLSESELAIGLKDLAFSETIRKTISSIFLVDNSLDQIRKIIKTNPALDEIDELLSFSREIGLEGIFSVSMVRGLDYYTGAIFECLNSSYPSSLAAGGRYDQLVENFSGEKLPSVGLSFGIDRLAELESQTTNPNRKETIFVLALDETYQETRQWVEELRDNGIKVELFIDPEVEIGKQLKFADKKGYREVLIPLAEDWSRNKIIRKNLLTGNQVVISLDRVIEN